MPSHQETPAIASDVEELLGQVRRCIGDNQRFLDDLCHENEEHEPVEDVMPAAGQDFFEEL